MPKVRDIMTMGVPQIDATASVLEAVNLMNERHANGTVVVQQGKPIGMFTERSLLRRFAKLDKRPDEVKVKDVMAPS